MRLLENFLICALLVIFLQFAPMTSKAQEPTSSESQWKPEIDPAGKARIRFAEDFWDFGSIPAEAVVKHDFPFENTGSDTLVITRVKPTCGCTTAPLSSDRIGPGETAELTAYLNTKKLGGSVRKSILIDTNDPINPYLKISFSARIDDSLSTITAEPSIADFGSFGKDTKARVVLKITNRDSAPAELAVVDSDPDDILRASLNKKSLQGGESTTLDLEIMSDLSGGSFVSSLTLEAAGKVGGRITIPIEGTVIE